MNARAIIPADSPEFVLERVFNAPREQVYRIWTDPKYVRQWWGVDGSTITFCELDVRPGGAFRIDMRASDGTVYINRGLYVEVIANERIVTRDERRAGEPPGNVPAAIHTIMFEDVDGKTRVTLTSHFERIEDRDLVVRYGMVDGITQSLERFENLVTTMHEKGN